MTDHAEALANALVGLAVSWALVAILRAYRKRKVRQNRAECQVRLAYVAYVPEDDR